MMKGRYRTIPASARRRMTKPIVRDPIYRRRRFDAEIIELCVRWYLPIELSGSRGDDVRARYCRVAHDDSSLGDSLCAGVREAMEPLRTAGEYFLARRRNIYKHSRRVELSLSRCRQARQDGGFSASSASPHRRIAASPHRRIAAAQAFFRKALSRSLPRWPRKITLDGYRQSHLALRLLRREDPKWKYVEVRTSSYLNNLIEQDHRASKRRCAPPWEASSLSGVRPLH